jgi:NADPH-dependent 7-cyano-7-deazaguanine reductase QueF-like protein
MGDDIMASLELVVSVGAGLAAVGIGFVVIDYFLVRLVKRMYPQGSQAWTQMDISHLNAKDQRRFQAIPTRYEEVTSHKMRRLGLAVSACGLLILVGCGIWHFVSR